MSNSGSPPDRQDCDEPSAHDPAMAIEPHGHGRSARRARLAERRARRGAAAPTTGRASTSTTPSTCSSPCSRDSASGRRPELLDIACGSGLAVRIADAMGATVAGIDAAADLIAVARERTPTADLRVGSMYELPWADESFDAAMSVNGIWGGCEAALDEAFRVLRPGGLIGISFWGTGTAARHPDLLPHLRRPRPAGAPRIHAAAQRHQHSGRCRSDADAPAASRCSSEAAARR